MKQKYEELKLEVILFDNRDVIVTSETPDKNEGPNQSNI